MWRTRSSGGCGRGASPCRTVWLRAPATSSPRIWATRSRAMSSGVRRKCAASGRRTARCAQRWRWRAAPSRPRISSPWPPLRHPRPRGTRLPPHVVGIIGAGRAGVGLALALARAGEGKGGRGRGRGRYDVRLHGRSNKPVPKPLKLTVGPENEPPAWIAQAGVVILAVRGDAIRPLAEALARAGAIRAEHVVLHLSGAQGQEALGPLVASRAALGSLHPLQTISDPERAPERLKGAWAAVGGIPRAVEAAEALARDLGLRPFHIPSKAKPIYHASAVFASNYFVVVEAGAQRLLRHAGLTDAEAWQALRPLVEGTLANLLHAEPQDALTGPVVRGDDTTIRRHLESLTKDDALLYRALGRAALELAQKRGMNEATAAHVAAELATDLPPWMRKAHRPSN